MTTNKSIKKTSKRPQIIIATQFHMEHNSSWVYLYELIQDVYLLTTWAIQQGYSVVVRFRGNHLACIPQLLQLITNKDLGYCLNEVQQSTKNNQRKISFTFPNSSIASIEWNSKRRTQKVLADKSKNSLLCLIGRSSGIMLEAFYHQIPVLYHYKNEQNDYLIEHKIMFSDFVNVYRTISSMKKEISNFFNIS